MDLAESSGVGGSREVDRNREQGQKRYDLRSANDRPGAAHATSMSNPVSMEGGVRRSAATVVFEGVDSKPVPPTDRSRSSSPASDQYEPPGIKTPPRGRASPEQVEVESAPERRNLLGRPDDRRIILTRRSQNQ